MPKKAVVKKAEPVGRPSKFDDIFVSKKIIGAYELAKAHKTIAQIAVFLEIAESTYYEWVKTYEKFSEFHKKIRTFQKASFYDFIDKNLLNSKANNVLIILKARTICGFHNHQYDEQTDTLPKHVRDKLLAIKTGVQDRMDLLNDLNLQYGLNNTAVQKQMAVFRSQLDVENERRGIEAQTEVAQLKNEVNNLKRLTS